RDPVVLPRRPVTHRCRSHSRTCHFAFSSRIDGGGFTDGVAPGPARPLLEAAAWLRGSLVGFDRPHGVPDVRPDPAAPLPEVDLGEEALEPLFLVVDQPEACFAFFAGERDAITSAHGILGRWRELPATGVANRIYVTRDVVLRVASDHPDAIADAQKESRPT